MTAPDLHALALKTAQEWSGNVDGPPSLVHAIKSALAKLQAQHEAERIDEGEHCQVCGRAYLDVYSVPDDVWAKISPRQVEGFNGGGLLCPTCALDCVIKLVNAERTAVVAEALERAAENCAPARSCSTDR